MQQRISAATLHRGGDDDDGHHQSYQVGILINNAAECPKRQKLVDRPYKDSSNNNVIKIASIDKQFATNVLGYHFMLRAFEDHFSLLSSSSSSTTKTTTTTTHIVNVASNWAGDLDLDDLHFQKRRRYDNDTAYRQSKQCNRMLNQYWSNKRLQNKALVNACHPGDPCTTLSQDLGYNLYAPKPSKEEIATNSPFPLLCGFKTKRHHHELFATTGGWFEGTGIKPHRCQFERLSQDAERLFKLCESFCI